MNTKRERREATLDLPPREEAPGFRPSLRERAGFRVTLDGDSATVHGEELPPPLLSAHRLLRQGEDRQRLWDALERFPRKKYDSSEYYEAALRDVGRMAEMETPEGMLGALSLLMLVIDNDDLRRVFERELDGLFTAFPHGTLWMLGADDRLLARVSLMHILFQFDQTPDLPLGKESESYRRSLQAQSSTQGVSFADAVQPIFLAFSPAATGYAFSWAPHALILEFGAVIDLRRDSPSSLGSLYESTALRPPVEAKQLADWSKYVPGPSLATLLAWWVDRLNRLYWIATDPTRFVQPDGRHDAPAGLAYFLTLERVLDDMRTLGAMPQASPLVRLNVAFDLLDKLETLLGYGPRARRKYGDSWGSGRGFERLLNRSRTLPEIQGAFGNMPLTWSSSFAARAEELFAEIYDEVREGVLVSRLRNDGVVVGNDGSQILKWDDYVGQVVRSVRNSSHGLLDQLAGRQVEVAATHTGALPASLPDLIFLIGLALLADPEHLWEARQTPR